MNIVCRSPLLTFVDRLVLLFLITTCLAPVVSRAVEDNPPTLVGDQASYNGFKYGFEGFQTPTHKYLQQVVAVTNGGTKTSTTTVDPKTGQRSTHTTGSSGADYGGSWTIDSDTDRHRSGSSGTQTSQTSTSSSNLYTTEQLKHNVEGWVPAFPGNFLEDVDFALILLSPGELSYTITKLNYKWKTPADPNGAVFWDVVFKPADNSEDGHEQHGWATGGQMESQVYTIDPTTLNDKKDGIYIVKLQNNDVIQVDAFIPQEWVAVPGEPDVLFVDSGNNRKTPLDGSLTTGSAVYDREGDFKIRHRQSLTPLANADPGGSIEAGTAKVLCGETRQYVYQDLVNGHIPDGLEPDSRGTATPNVAPVTIEHPAEGIVKITIEDRATNPLVWASQFAPIHIKTTITIDRSVPGNPTYTVTGTHCRFPAYEVYINKNLVHQYSPIPDCVDVYGLFDLDKSFNNHGSL